MVKGPMERSISENSPEIGPGAEPVRQILREVFDPEIPVLTLEDLGVIRSIQVEGKKARILLSPTYSGCPAMDTMAADIRTALSRQGWESEVELVLHPAWSTDWISPEGQQKMREYGIAPPLSPEADKQVLFQDRKLVPCTRCGSTQTRLISPFGSTACKALFQCETCHEPFDYFKCLK
jgi:ring-1,2-phenylacetyl-CoA epoxidase subunit PaaD